jgi:hypothetical protein
MHFRLLALLGCSFLSVQAQDAVHADSLGACHFRGLAACNKRVLWASGTKGNVFRSTNGGTTWKAVPVSAFPRRDFRDIHAWNRRSALAMSSGDSAVIMRTRNGGKTWAPVYQNNQDGIFLDALDFHRRKGVCLGDPMPVSTSPDALRYLLLITDDAGKSWKEFWPDMPARAGEAAFAASGSCVRYFAGTSNDHIVWITGGGPQVRMPEVLRIGPHALQNGNNTYLPLRGGTGWGAYTMTLVALRQGIILGGNYQEHQRRDSIAAWFNLDSNRFEPAHEAPGGYRSGSCYNSKHKLFFCTGTNGTDVSSDAGKQWTMFSRLGGNVCVSKGNYLWIAASKGKVYRFILRT